ncbi:MAG TPA: TatD family hydrolase [Chthoniobacter sp.]|jgi:TatD DNase family protein
MMNLIDAHNHLHDTRLAPHRAAILAELQRLHVTRAVVNGTQENDWDAVSALSHEHDFVIPSFGLHPWYVAKRTPDWFTKLREKLIAHPNAGVGEIGLDRWIEGHDLDTQTEVFLPQLAFAAELNRPVTIHCLRAWGALNDLLHKHPLPQRGFLLHAYGGPAEMVAGFVALGAYFSFNAYFLAERKTRQRETFREIPMDRLLVETDAPSMPPPEKLNAYPIRDERGELLNHPANIMLAYEKLAEIRAVPAEALAAQVTINFSQLFRGADRAIAG